MKRVVALFAAVALLVVWGAGCGGDDTGVEAGDAAGNSTASGGSEQFNALESPGKVPGLIRDHLGESPEIRRLSLSDNGFTVQVRDAIKRDNLDDYSYYNGEWESRPVSVTLADIAEYESVTFSLGDINWDAIPGLIDQALAGLDLEGEEVGGVSFDRLSGERPRVYLSVSGLRGSGRLIANADGTEVDIQRN